MSCSDGTRLQVGKQQGLHMRQLAQDSNLDIHAIYFVNVKGRGSEIGGSR
jgi:hypothetical protein